MMSQEEKINFKLDKLKIIDNLGILHWFSFLACY